MLLYIFFRQNTAYELHVGDWSADVCSSDLAVRVGLLQASLPGRFQILPGQPAVILDVAHNPHAAAVLAQNLDNMGFHPYTHAVFGMLNDKDVAAVQIGRASCRESVGKYV